MRKDWRRVQVDKRICYVTRGAVGFWVSEDKIDSPATFFVTLAGADFINNIPVPQSCLCQCQTGRAQECLHTRAAEAAQKFLASCNSVSSNITA